ncbi:MAG: hypothetical protein MJ025_07270 [Victivallaceae bacterium]|nr:hypothetical protein [Victivallaceae bacterium]
MISPDKFEKGALDIARRKLVTESSSELVSVPRIGTGGGFTDIFQWDTAFSALWAKYYPREFFIENSLDNFYRLQDERGFISRQYLPDGRSLWGREYPISYAPPLLGWAELELYRETGDRARLARVFPHLVHQFHWNIEHYRRDDGLFFTDSWGCGMDDIPRWNSVSELTPEGGVPVDRGIIAMEGSEGDKKFQSLLKWNEAHHFDWNRQVGWCDASCQMAFAALKLSSIAAICGDAECEREMLEFHSEESAIINELCYDEREGFYFDRLGEGRVMHRHVGAFWALAARVATDESAGRLISELKNPNRFGMPCGVPGIAADDPEFNLERGYWRGPVWAPVNYMVLRGLAAYGEDRLAKTIAQRIHHAAMELFESTGTVWENYRPDRSDIPSANANRDFCGWSALIPVTIRREFLE